MIYLCSIFYFAYKCNFLAFQPSWSDGILIYCKACSENITTSDHLINIRSEQSIGMERINLERYNKNRTSSQYSYEKWIVCLRTWNYCTRNLIIFYKCSIRIFHSVLKYKSVKEFVNPGGYHFELVTVTEADVLLTGQRVSSDTFFLGFDWTIAVCPKCKNHIGWGFTPTNAPVGTEPTFYALIHEKLFYEMDG